MKSVEILEKLIAFPTVSRQPNLALIEFVKSHLEQCGADCQLIHDETGTKANLFATIGSKEKSGVMLSGHTDVVPITGQNWTVDPFKLKKQDGRLFGRGTADMKGFVACMLRAAELASRQELKTPLHIALSYDEEIGCVGVRRLVDMMENAPYKPAFCIVGEPTSLAIATGHKGKTAINVKCIGREAHSALAPTASNAIHLAADFINAIRTKQAEIVSSGSKDGDYDVPYTTLHIGTITGGTVLNIVPNLCEMEFEIRNLSSDDPMQILRDLRDAANRIVTIEQQRIPEADIQIDVHNAYPGLDTPTNSAVVNFVKSLNGANSTFKVAFGTEGGLFSNKLSIPTVVCGPGSMAQGHKPDEFVTEEQINLCDKMMDRLIERLQNGIQ